MIQNWPDWFTAWNAGPFRAPRTFRFQLAMQVFARMNTKCIQTLYTCRNDAQSMPVSIAPLMPGKILTLSPHVQIQAVLQWIGTASCHNSHVGCFVARLSNLNDTYDEGKFCDFPQTARWPPSTLGAMQLPRAGAASSRVLAKCAATYGRALCSRHTSRSLSILGLETHSWVLRTMSCAINHRNGTS